MIVSEGRSSPVGGDYLVRIPERLANALHQLYTLRTAVSLDGLVSLLPDGLTVLVEADPLDIEMFADYFDDLHWFSLHQVELPSMVPELCVQVLKALQQEGDLVEPAVLRCGCFTVEDKHWQQLDSFVLCGLQQALVVVQPQSISKPQNIDSLLLVHLMAELCLWRL